MEHDRRASAIVGLILGLLLAQSAMAAGPGAGKTVALVLQKQGEPEAVASDAKVKARLEELGYQVQMIDQVEPAAAAERADLILISSSVSANKLEAKYRMTSRPVVLWESYLLPHMGMAGLKEEGDYGTKEHTRYTWLVNSPHQLSGGLAAGMRNVYQKNGPMNWGKPGLGASIIATVPGDPDKVLEFAYEKGATMDHENIAPGRRVFIFLDATFPNLNEAGLKLFDAAVAWAAATPTCR